MTLFFRREKIVKKKKVVETVPGANVLHVTEQIVDYRTPLSDFSGAIRFDCPEKVMVEAYNSTMCGKRRMVQFGLFRFKCVLNRKQVIIKMLESGFRQPRMIELFSYAKKLPKNKGEITVFALDALTHMRGETFVSYLERDGVGSSTIRFVGDGGYYINCYFLGVHI